VLIIKISIPLIKERFFGNVLFLQTRRPGAWLVYVFFMLFFFGLLIFHKLKP
jgi:hypothetical protein